MNFIETALELEKRAIQMFRDLAGQCASNEGIKNILNMLADDQEKHKQAFTEMLESSCGEKMSAQIFSRVKGLFERMQEDKKTFSCDLDQLNLYKQARDLVLKKQSLYTDMADSVDCPGDREVLRTIADQERRQSIVLDNIIEMVNRPNSWLEDAEFNHLDEY